MKSIKYLLLLNSLIFFACDVDRIPETQLSDASFWKSENDLKSAVNYFYTFLPELLVTDDIWSDDAFGQVSNGISDGSRIPESASSFYSDPYKLIRAVNNVLVKAPLVADAGVPEEIIDKYTGEAYFFRAWAYFQLFQKYGGVPLIQRPLEDDAEELTAPKASREETLSFIYSDLDLAVDKLPDPSAMTDADYGRISKTAALAFKARVALFEGTRMKFHQYGEATYHLGIAAETAKKVMESQEHDLFDNYFDLFQDAGDGRQNLENILVRQYGVSLNNNIQSHNSANLLENGFVSPTKALVDSYLMNDGLPIDQSPLYEIPETSEEVFANRDPRLGASVMKKGDPFVLGRPVFGVANLALNKTGFMGRKFFNSQDHERHAGFMDYPIIRYAEVLLTYAEAQFELNGSISDQDLNISINLLRDRVSMPHLTNTFVENNGLDMREEIRRERRVELALEGFRYWDIIRWKTAEVELPKPVLGNYFFDEYGPVSGVLLTPDNYIIAQEGTTRSFDDERDYLWPFPVSELALNPSLVQNPKW